MEKIKAMANREKAEYMRHFESLPEVEQYGKILDRVPHQKFMQFIGDKRALEEKLPAIREYFYTIYEKKEDSFFLICSCDFYFRTYS